MKKILLFLATSWSLVSHAQSNNALSLDGIDDYADISNNSLYNWGPQQSFTFETWYFQSGVGANSAIFGKHDGNTAATFRIYWGFYVDANNKLSFGMQSYGGSGWESIATSVTDVPVNRWVHVALVKSGQNVTVYQDGLVVATGSLSAYLYNYSNDSYGNTEIGRMATPGSGGFYYGSGMMDEVRIWNVALSQPTLLAWMNRQLSSLHPSRSALLGYYGFSEASGNSIVDKVSAVNTSATANDGSLQNGATRGAGNARVTSVALPKMKMGYFTVLPTSGGKTYTFGHGVFGQLGNNQTVNSSNPIDISANGSLAGKNVVSVTQGHSFAFAICDDGTLHAWGYNVYGQLGNGTTTSSSVPVNITNNGSLNGKTVVGIWAGDGHALALCSDGTVHAWGSNSVSGQVGDNTGANRSLPVNISAKGSLVGRTVVSMGAGNGHSMAICSDGTVHTWGNNLYGQLGDGNASHQYQPVQITTKGSLSGRKVIAITGGVNHSVALTSDGVVHTFGRNENGQLGTGANSNLPVSLESTGALSGVFVTGIAAGSFHSMAVDADGKVYAWGNGGSGQLGNNSTASQSSPILIPTSGFADKRVVEIAAGHGHSLASCADGTVYLWGNGGTGQLAQCTTTDSRVPVIPKATNCAGRLVLPLVWKSFVARNAGNNVELLWSTAHETNTRDFVVEHSVNGMQWKQLSILPAAGNSAAILHYSYQHLAPGNGTHHYRIRQCDIDGASGYSEVRQVVIGEASSLVIQNPVRSNLLQLNVTTPAVYSLYTAEGQLTWSAKLNTGYQQLALPSLPKGIYLLDNGKQKVKLVVE